MKLRWQRARELKSVTEENQAVADEAMAHNEAVSDELDNLVRQFTASVERLRQLNQENNFSQKMRDALS